MKDFDGWNIKKKKLDLVSETLWFKEGEIWWCTIGLNVGEEVCGKGDNFRRTVLIFKKLSRRTCLVIPLTTQPREGSWYTRLVSGERQAWTMNHQIKFTSVSRLDKRIGTISHKDFQKQKESLANLLGFLSNIVPES